MGRAIVVARVQRDETWFQAHFSKYFVLCVHGHENGDFDLRIIDVSNLIPVLVLVASKGDKSQYLPIWTPSSTF
jgi:hypothetical protein